MTEVLSPQYRRYASAVRFGRLRPLLSILIHKVRFWRDMLEFDPNYPPPYDQSIIDFADRCAAWRDEEEREQREIAYKRINRILERRKGERHMANEGKDPRTDEMNRVLDKQQAERNVAAGLKPEGGHRDGPDTAADERSAEPRNPPGTARAGDGEGAAAGSAPEDSGRDLEGAGQDSGAGGSGSDPGAVDSGAAAADAGDAAGSAGEAAPST